MHNFTHKRLAEEIKRLDEAPAENDSFSKWILAEQHLGFLRRNACDDDIVIYASGSFSFIHSLVVKNDKLSPVDKEDLLGWQLHSNSQMASYKSSGGNGPVSIEYGLGDTSTKSLVGAKQLFFTRTFEGWSDSGKNYIEVHQEYTHLTDIHWRPERRAYCRYDERGDIEPLVSVTAREDKNSGLALLTFKWRPLEEYLAASDASLVRVFDFTLFRPNGFNGWAEREEAVIDDASEFFYRQKVDPGQAAYTRGIQIICPRRPKQQIFSGITDRWFGRTDKQYVEFLAYDWRNQRVGTISTDPVATTNYFNCDGNSLPYELSPAFFRPEVLLKYKADREKYSVSERSVSCRNAWHLKGIDVNEAGQVHAYICYLRSLPYEEQLHWKSFNEQPKASISERAVKNDFMGEWVDFTEPLAKVLSLIHRWNTSKVGWWALRDEKLLGRVNTPLSASRDEWADAIMELAKLVVEGFETKPIRAKLDAFGVQYEKEERTIGLLEKVHNAIDPSGGIKKLDGLRTVQMLRSKVKGHAVGSEADDLSQEALANHDSYANHFRHLCTVMSNELESIERELSK